MYGLSMYAQVKVSKEVVAKPPRELCRALYHTKKNARCARNMLG